MALAHLLCMASLLYVFCTPKMHDTYQVAVACSLFMMFYIRIVKEHAQHLVCSIKQWADQLEIKTYYSNYAVFPFATVQYVTIKCVSSPIPPLFCFHKYQVYDHDLESESP